MEKFKFLSKSRISQLPKNPGVYVFKNKKEILYIGKAANLKERVKNHFQQPSYRENLFLKKVHLVKCRGAAISPKAKLFNGVKKIGFIKSNSEIEALLLEANLIKKYQPKYNVMWRDDKNYFYVGITKEDFPRVFITHQPKNLKSEILNIKSDYVGPFVDGKSLKSTLKVLRRVFPYRNCNIIPKRPCLWYQLNRCPAPCLIKPGVALQISNFKTRIQKECQKNVKNLIKILQGKKKQVLKDLKREMKEVSKKQDYEKAAKIRDQIKSLEKILCHAKIFEELIVPRSSAWNYRKIEERLKKIVGTKRKIAKIEAYDVSNIAGKEATGAMVTFVDGLPNKNYYRKFKIRIAGKPNDTVMIKEILSRRLKHSEWPYPDLILIDGGKAQLNVAVKIKDSRLKIKDIKVMALAKKHNELFIESKKKPILLKKLPREIFNLILQLRDEAHRFALTYHKKLRKKELLN